MAKLAPGCNVETCRCQDTEVVNDNNIDQDTDHDYGHYHQDCVHDNSNYNDNPHDDDNGSEFKRKGKRRSPVTQDP